VKKIVIPIKLPEKRSLDIDFPEDGVIKKALIHHEAVSNIIAGVGDGANGRPMVREIIVLVVECTPKVGENGQLSDPNIVKRHFLVAASGEMVDEEKLDYLDTVIGLRSGTLMHVFEIIPRDEREQGKFCSKCGRSVKTWYASDEGPCKCPYPYPPTSE
jgi:hypothetical protein